jgi:hypothetical protein
VSFGESYRFLHLLHPVSPDVVAPNHAASTHASHAPSPPPLPTSPPPMTKQMGSALAGELKAEKPKSVGVVLPEGAGEYCVACVDVPDAYVPMTHVPERGVLKARTRAWGILQTLDVCIWRSGSVMRSLFGTEAVHPPHQSTHVTCNIPKSHTSSTTATRNTVR